MEDFAWNTFLLYSLIGFFAQIIDGSMGMAYGVITNSLLLSVGISPLTASASVHVSKVFTTLISGLSHLKFKNVHREIIRNLIIPGVLGGIAGAYLLLKVSGDVLQPIIGAYLLMMGIRIFIKAFNRTPGIKFTKTHYVFLGWFGGFFDAIGGGGWGPIVTSTLLSQDESPRKIIGSVNIAEFFVSFAQSALFIAGIGLMPLDIVIGLIIGGAIAAPIAAYLTSRIPTKVMYFVIGTIIILMQIRLFIQLMQ